MNLALSPADQKLLNEVFDDTFIEQRAAPWFHTALDGIQEMAAIQDEIRQRGRPLGMFNERENEINVRRVGHFPDGMSVAAIIAVDPEIMTDPKKHMAFLNSPAGRKFNVSRRGKI